MKLLRDLKHPHVVTCYGLLSTLDGLIHIVTELCIVPLDAFLEDECQWQHDSTTRAAMTPGMVDAQKLRVLRHVSLGLQQLHDLDVLHRDIKAANVIAQLDQGGKHTWKICDFGEAKVLRRAHLAFEAPRPWVSDFMRGLQALGRFMPVTSQALRECGARFYCCRTRTAQRLARGVRGKESW